MVVCRKGARASLLVLGEAGGLEVRGWWCAEGRDELGRFDGVAVVLGEGRG